MVTVILGLLCARYSSTQHSIYSIYTHIHIYIYVKIIYTDLIFITTYLKNPKYMYTSPTYSL